jgi:hypothetical protein
LPLQEVITKVQRLNKKFFAICKDKRMLMEMSNWGKTPVEQTSSEKSIRAITPEIEDDAMRSRRMSEELEIKGLAVAAEA